MSSIEFINSTRTVKNIVTDMVHDKIKVPVHQRKGGVWTPLKKVLFIESCKQGFPIPSILLFEDVDGVTWIEDGLQRITTLKEFITDEFKFSEKDEKKFQEVHGYKKFTELSQLEKVLFEKYTLATLTYRNATTAQRIEIFDRFQNGSPLKVGERLHSLEDISPLVKFTLEVFNREDIKNRVDTLWGGIVFETDKRYEQLSKLTALMNGIIYGCEPLPDGGGLSKKYDDLRKTLTSEITHDMKEYAVNVLNQVFTIYEKAEERVPIEDKKMKTCVTKFQKEIGNITGAVVYSLQKHPTEWEFVIEKWVSFMVEYREQVKKNTATEFLKRTVHKDLSKARSWNIKRWDTTYRNIFGGIVSPSRAYSTDEDDEDDESED